MSRLKRILLVDDSPRDTELAIDALEKYRLANSIVTARDGAKLWITCSAEALSPVESMINPR